MYDGGHCRECGGDGWQIAPTPGDAGVRCPACKGDVWHSISSDDLLAMLRRVAAGEDPELVYLEEYVNAEHTQIEGTL